MEAIQQEEIKTRPDARIRIKKEAEARKNTLKETISFLQQATMPIVFEIGCGNGHYLTAYAQENPDKLCIGIDLLGHRLRCSNKKKHNNFIENIHFIKAEAGEFIEALSQKPIISEVFILFPDPWPKRRHHKNRLIQPEFLSRLAKICKEGAPLHFRTDHQEYFKWAHARVEAHTMWSITPETPWPLEVETLFQQRAPSYNSLIAKRLAD